MPETPEAEAHRLREALLDLCAERGYKKLKLKQLLERAEVDKAYFRQHYADLDDYFAAVLGQIYDEFFERLQQALDGVSGWRDRCRATGYAMLRFLRRDERVARLSAVEAQYAGKQARGLFLETFNRLIQILDEGSSEAEGSDSPGLATAIGVGGVIFARVQEGVVNGELDELGEEEVPQLMYAAVFPYLGAEEAEKELHIPAPPYLGVVEQPR
jgi:AcrR family transcriptional regulator